MEQKGRITLPHKLGKTELTKNKNSLRLNYFALTLTNVEGSPVYQLQDELLLGKSIGDITINDDSLSDRHVTFRNRDGLLMLMDHGSVQGTYIQGTRAPAGKWIIFDVKDSLRVGDIFLKFEAVTKIIPIPYVGEIPQIKIIKKTDIIQHQTQPKNSVKKNKNKSPFILTRGLAFTTDLMIAALALQMINWSAILSEIQRLLPPIGQEMSYYLAPLFYFIPLIVVTLAFRLLSIAISGKTVGQWISGQKLSGPKKYKRIRAFGREVSGGILRPLLIFDLPMLWEGIPLSERIWSSRLVVSHQLQPFLRSLMGAGLSLGIVLVSPAVTLPIPAYESQPPRQFNEITETLKQDVVMSEWNMSLKIPARDMAITQFYSVKENQGIKLRPMLLFYSAKTQETYQFLLRKRFDLRQWLMTGLGGDLWALYRYPVITDYLQGDQILDRFQRQRLMNELESLMRTVFNGGFNLLPSGRRKMIQELQYLLEVDRFADIQTMTMGEIPFLRIGTQSVQQKDWLIPLWPEQGQVFEVMSKSHQTNSIMNFYQNVIYRWDFRKETAQPSLHDKVQILLKSPASINHDVQMVYGEIFEMTHDVLRSGENKKIELHLAALKSWEKSFRSILESNKFQKLTDQQKEIWKTLDKNFSLLKQALEDKNLGYFQDIQ